MKWMLYGCTGYTGGLIAAEAARRGLKPVLAGRDARKVKAAALQYGFEWTSFPVSGFHGRLEGFDALVLAAGPFVHTYEPAAAECLRVGACYLDVTGEIPVFAALYARDAEARHAGAALIPGMGFDVVPTDCLAVYAVENFRSLYGASPSHLQIAVCTDGVFSGGTLKTMLEMAALPGMGFQVKNGKIIPSPWGARVKSFSFGKFERTAAGVPMADLLSAQKSTGAANVETYAVVSESALSWARSLRPLLGTAVKVGFLRKAAQAAVKAWVRGPDEHTRQNARSYFYAQASDGAGRSFEARMESIEAYRMTALCVVNAVETLAQNRPVGALTPAQAFGADFVLRLPDTHRFPER
ncbi:MAG: saccharopine dehydrogenase [Bacteroidia bacterium]|nr:saccharopine dehydrogenase [Bacteroidia bacterium]MDW8333299.1 saccharopine dehydrogenase [Bacteroidia bacterium]